MRKNVIMAGVLLGFLMVMGCKEKTVDVKQVARDYMMQKVSFDKNVTTDPAPLTFTVVKEDAHAAVVKIAGTVKYEGQLNFKRVGDKWELALPAAN